MIIGAVLAGGSGTRMGCGTVPKQFLKLGGREIILHTIGNMLAYEGFKRILVLSPEEWAPETGRLIEGCFGPELMDRIEVMAGGKTRTETLMRAAARAAELAEGEEVILLTHDGVRPFVSERMIRESVEAAEETGASVVAVPAVDTMLMSRDGRIVDSVPERKTLYNAQTPQTFRLSKLMRLYEELTDAERDRLTDGASIFTAKGEPVALVMGSGTNIKITYPSDLVIAEAVLGSEGEGFGGKGNKE